MRTVDVGVVRAVGANALQVVADSNAIGIRDFILLYIFVVDIELPPPLCFIMVIDGI